MAKIIFKGFVSDKEEFEYVPLPSGSRKIINPNNYLLFSFLCAVPFILLCRICYEYKKNLAGGFPFNRWYGIAGFICGILLIPVHEWLHAIAYPNNSVVEIRLKMKSFVGYIECSSTISRTRYIVISILPIILGIIPMTVFMIIPVNCKEINTVLWVCGIFNFVTPCSDYFDTINVLRKVPKDANILAQEDGFYWYRNCKSNSKDSY